MTGPQHYLEAQREIAYANEAEFGSEMNYHIALAQVHATLALAAATVTNGVAENRPSWSVAIAS
jgi:hypothetical protein